MAGTSGSRTRKLEQGYSDRARTLYAEGISILQELGDKQGVAESLEGLAAMMVQSEPQRAVRLWGTAHVLRESLSAPLSAVEQERVDNQMVQARLTLGEVNFAATWEEGCTLPWETSVTNALWEVYQTRVAASFTNSSVPVT